MMKEKNNLLRNVLVVGFHEEKAYLKVLFSQIDSHSSETLEEKSAN